MKKAIPGILKRGLSCLLALCLCAGLMTGTAAPARYETAENMDQALAKLIGDVKNAPAKRLQLKDDRGNKMKRIKIIDRTLNSQGEYLAVYAVERGAVSQVNLAESTDLLNWKYVCTLSNKEKNADNPSIALSLSGGYAAVWEVFDEEFCYRTAYYEGFNSLKVASPSETGAVFANQSRIFSDFEGAPAICQVGRRLGNGMTTVAFLVNSRAPYDTLIESAGDTRQVLIDSGFGEDYSERDYKKIDKAVTVVLGKDFVVQDRDCMLTKENYSYLLLGFNKHGTQGGCQRFYLSKLSNAELLPLNMQTPGGSKAFTHATISEVTAKDGSKAGCKLLACSLDIPAESAAAGEAGVCVYYYKMPVRMKDGSYRIDRTALGNSSSSYPTGSRPVSSSSRPSGFRGGIASMPGTAAPNSVIQKDQDMPTGSSGKSASVTEVSSAASSHGGRTREDSITLIAILVTALALGAAALLVLLMVIRGRKSG